MFKRKTIKRLTRLGLFCYLWLYCMGLTVCADPFPTPYRMDIGAPAVVYASSLEGQLRGSGDRIIFDGDTVSGLLQMIEADGSSLSGKTIVLKNDLIADDYNSTGSGAGTPNNLTIDGNGFKIEPADNSGNDTMLPLDSEVFLNTSDLTIENIVFQGNNAGGAIALGGAQYQYGSVPRNLTILNCSFDNASADYGGAVYGGNTGDSLTIINCNFTNNIAAETGGAVRFDGGSVSFNNCFFNNNSVLNDTHGVGGAIFVRDARLNITDCEFANNTATIGGGAIYLYDSQKMTIEGNVFTGNEGKAGVISVQDSSGASSVTNNIFLNNNVSEKNIQIEGSGGVNTNYNWFGNTLQNYDNSSSDAAVWYVLGGERIIDSSGQYRLKAAMYAYNSTSKKAVKVNPSAYNLPEIALLCEAVYGLEFDNGSGEFILDNSAGNISEGFRIVQTNDQFGYAVNLTVNGTNISIPLVYTRSLVIDSLTDENGAIMYDPAEGGAYCGITGIETSVQNVISANGTIEKNKLVNLTLPEEIMEGQVVSVNIRNGENEIYAANHTINSGGIVLELTDNQAVKGIYNTTFEARTFKPETKNLNVSRTSTTVKYVNGTAEDAGVTDPAKLTVKKIDDFTQGEGGLLRFYAAGTDSKMADAGILYVLNGTEDFNFDDVMFETELTGERPYAELDLSVLAPGSYEIFAVYDGGGDYCHSSSFENRLSFRVKEKAAVTPPEAKEGLVFNGAAQELVSKGTADGGKMYYALGTDDKTAPDTGDTGKWQTSVPTGKDAGAYYVWYMAKGDDDHGDTTPACVPVTIAPKSITGAAVTLSAAQLSYNGAEQTVTVTGVTAGDLVLTADDYDVSGNRGTAKNKYTVTVTGKGNYKDTASAEWQIVDNAMTVNSGDVNVTYDGKPHGISVTVTQPANGAVIKYGKAAGTYDLDACPEITNAGTMTVYYKVTAEGYSDYTGSATVNIAKKKIDIPAAVKGLVYDGKKKTGVKGGDGYTVSGNKAADAGTYKAKAALTDPANTQWSDGTSEEKTVAWSIAEKAAKPLSAELQLNSKLKLTYKNGSLNFKWGKVDGAKGYYVYAAYCSSKFSKKPSMTVKNPKTTSVKIKKINGKKLKTNQCFKTKVEAYGTNKKGKKTVIAKSLSLHLAGKENKKFTNLASVKLKKTAYTLKKGSSVKIKPKYTLADPGKKPITHKPMFRYATSDKAVAKVDKNGKIRAVGKGKCTVFVYEIVGKPKKISVTVK